MPSRPTCSKRIGRAKMQMHAGICAFIIFCSMPVAAAPSSTTADGSTRSKSPTLQIETENNENSTTLPQKYRLKWQMRLSGRDARDEQSASSIVEYRLSLDFKYQLADSLLFDLFPIVKMQSGSSTTVDNSGKAENKLAIKQAAIHWGPFRDDVRLSAGALDQTTLNSRLLMGDFAFPGLRASWLPALTPEVSILLAAESAIPTYAASSTNTNSIETNPTFNTATLGLSWKTRDSVNWETKVGYFSFHDLPMAMAQDGGIWGNTTEQIAATENRFKFEYRGFQGTSSIVLPIGKKFSAIAEGSFVQNDGAPEGFNRATLGVIGSEFHLNNKYDLGFAFGGFKIEPDAVVANFVPMKFMGTNRQGYVGSTTLRFLQQRFAVNLEYSEADLIYISSVQSKERAMFIKVETFYERF